MTTDNLPPCPVPGCGKEMRRTSSGIIWHGGHSPAHWIEFGSEEQFTRLCELVEAGRNAEKEIAELKAKLADLQKEYDQIYDANGGYDGSFG